MCHRQAVGRVGSARGPDPYSRLAPDRTGSSDHSGRVTSGTSNGRSHPTLDAADRVPRVGTEVLHQKLAYAVSAFNRLPERPMQDDDGLPTEDSALIGSVFDAIWDATKLLAYHVGASW